MCSRRCSIYKSGRVRGDEGGLCWSWISARPVARLGQSQRQQVAPASAAASAQRPLLPQLFFRSTLINSNISSHFLCIQSKRQATIHTSRADKIVMADRSFPVTVHPYPAGKHRTGYAYELGTHPTPTRNALVFIGGLGDGPHTVEYIRTVAKKLSDAPRLGYSVFETRLSSAFAGYGFSSLAKDVKELSALVAYLRSLGKEKIVFSGHSTGCQVRSGRTRVRRPLFFSFSLMLTSSPRRTAWSTTTPGTVPIRSTDSYCRAPSRIARRSRRCSRRIR